MSSWSTGLNETWVLGARNGSNMNVGIQMHKSFPGWVIKTDMRSYIYPLEPPQSIQINKGGTKLKYCCPTFHSFKLTDPTATTTSSPGPEPTTFSPDTSPYRKTQP